MKILEILFGDYAAREKARNEFHKLYQANLSFDDFILEFNRLANELGYINDKDKVGRLEEKLSVEMLNSIISVQDLPEDYLGFVKRLRRLNAAQKNYMSKRNT